MKNDISNTFKEKLYECDKHVEKIATAKKNLLEIMPLDILKYKVLSDMHSSFIDQLVFRFSKLQDTIGESIFPAILILSQEDVKKKTFIDRLNRLEELEVIEKDKWLKLREVRNEISHEYSFNIEEVIESILDVYDKSNELIEIYLHIKDFCQKKFYLEFIK